MTLDLADKRIEVQTGAGLPRYADKATDIMQHATESGAFL